MMWTISSTLRHSEWLLPQTVHLHDVDHLFHSQTLGMVIATNSTLHDVDHLIHSQTFGMVIATNSTFT